MVNDDDDTNIGEKETPRIKEDAVELREDATCYEGRKERGSKILLDQYSSSRRLDTPSQTQAELKVHQKQYSEMALLDELPGQDLGSSRLCESDRLNGPRLEL